METFVFEEVLKHGQVSNDTPSSIYYSKLNLQIQCQERRMITAMTVDDSNWYHYLQ